MTRPFGEVTDVGRDDDVRLAKHGGGDHVRVGAEFVQPGNERLVTFDCRVLESGLHRGGPLPKQLDRQIRPAPQNGGDHLREDLARPERAIEAPLGEPDQQVAEDHGMKDVGVQERGR